MKNKVFLFLTIAIMLGFATAAYSEIIASLVPKTDIAAPAVGEQVKINIKITGGEGITGYAAFVAFDKTALKYIGTTIADYLPPNSLWALPALNDDGDYEVRVSIGGKIISGKSVSLGPGPDAPALSVEEMFFKVPGPIPPEFAAPGAEYWGISLFASLPPGGNTDPSAVADDIPPASPLPPDTDPSAVADDGTFATLTFEVLDAKRTRIVLVNANLSDESDDPLEATLKNHVVILHNVVDVNGDGKVNILDLVRVATAFGDPVTDANRAADVNRDGEINILDLVQIAQNLGK